MTALLLGSLNIAQAQEGKRSGFASINTFNVMEGQGGTSFGLQSVNGWKYKTFFAGIGVGIDGYKVRSIPVFADIRKNIFQKPNTPFVYLEGGVNFPWTSDITDWYRIEYKAGLFYEGGLGYLLPVKGADLVFSAGYSFKGYKEERSYTVWCVDGDCPDRQENWTYQLRRISVRAGLRF